MNLEEIWRILSRERETSTLQKLPKNFYEEVSEYLKVLEKEISGSDEKKELVKDEIRSTRREIEFLFDQRMLKIAREAFLASRGVKIDHENFTKEEMEAFRELKKVGGKYRKRILEPALFPRKDEFLVVRMLKDITSFLGADGKTYSLSTEDIVVLPVANVDVLCKKGVALQLRGVK
jgi:DNA replication factor GINS